MMLQNEKAIEALRHECEIPEKGRSEHWNEMLQGFHELDGKFFGKGLPEGEGGNGNFIKEWIHTIFQSPYRQQGKKFKEFMPILNSAKKIHRRRNNHMRLGTLRQVISLACLEEHVKINSLTEPIIIIGDGFGIMSSLILEHYSQLKSKVVVVNLNQNLLIDAVYIRRSVPSVNLVLVNNEAAYNAALGEKNIRCVLIQADNANIMREIGMGLVINICSMQEMEPKIIKEYFELIRTSKNPITYFYCANRREKRLSDGSVVNFFNYPWLAQDQNLLDELCPWIQKFYSIRPPFYFPYDGPIQHRLTLMQKQSR